MLGIGKGGSSRRRKVQLSVGVLAAAALSLLAVTPVIGDGLNSSPAPAPRVIAATSPATSLQVAGAQGLSGASIQAAKKKKKKKAKPALKRITINSRITSHEILTEEGKGTFVGIKCPNGAKAVSGGVLSRYINLLVSSSAPNHPITRKYTPRIWWLTVTNVNVDGNGGTLPWQGIVNCLSPVRLAG